MYESEESMRKETMEYNYDWNIWTIMENASKSRDGSVKEYENLIRYVPNFKGILEAFIKQGEPGIKFLKLVAKYTNDCLTARERGKKLAITTFCFSGTILYAMDIQPISVEPWTVFGTFVLKRGTAEYLDYTSELGFTETSCSAQRGFLGAALGGLSVRPDFAIMDTAGVCDSNANSFSFLSTYLDIPLFQLNYPPTLTGEKARDYHRADFKALISFLEEQTGKKLDVSSLKETLEESKKQDELSIELMDLQSLVPSPMPPIFDLMVYAGKFMMSGKKELTELLQSMVNKVKENAKQGISGTHSGKEKIRALMCYIDHYTTDARFWQWMDEQDISSTSILYNFWQKGSIVARGHELDGYSIDTTNFDTMLDSLAAQNSRQPMIKQIRGPYDSPSMWLDDTAAMAKVMNVDMIIYIGTMGCRNTWGMVKPFTRDLEKMGYPTLVVFADAFDDRVASWETVRDKISEFIKVRKIKS